MENLKLYSLNEFGPEEDRGLIRVKIMVIDGLKSDRTTCAVFFQWLEVPIVGEMFEINLFKSGVNDSMPFVQRNQPLLQAITEIPGTPTVEQIRRVLDEHGFQYVGQFTHLSEVLAKHGFGLGVLHKNGKASIIRPPSKQTEPPPTPPPAKPLNPLWEQLKKNS